MEAGIGVRRRPSPGDGMSGTRVEIGVRRRLWPEDGMSGTRVEIEATTTSGVGSGNVELSCTGPGSGVRRHPWPRDGTSGTRGERRNGRRDARGWGEGGRGVWSGKSHPKRVRRHHHGEGSTPGASSEDGVSKETVTEGPKSEGESGERGDISMLAPEASLPPREESPAGGKGVATVWVTPPPNEPRGWWEAGGSWEGERL